MFSKNKLVLVLSIFSFFHLNAQVTLSSDFTDEDNESTALHNIWSIANRISPQSGSNVRPGLKMNTVRMIGGIKKTVNGENVKDLDFDTCLYDSINNQYVYKFERLIERLDNIINSQTEIHQIVLDQPPWAFQHGYTFIPEGTIDYVNFRENEQISIYGNSLPPADQVAYHDYIVALMTELVDNYGEDLVLSWRFRVGSEIETPDHWYGTKQDFIEHFENTESAIRAVLPNATIGLHTRAPDFLYQNGSVLNYKGEPFASFAEGLIEYCFDNNVQYDFWGISDYVVLGNGNLRNMSIKYNHLFADLVNHPEWDASATIDLMEYATVTTMNGADGNGFINAETSHAEIVELYFSNIFYKNKEEGLDLIYRWGNRTGSQDPPGISILNSMNGKVHYTTDISGTPETSTNDVDAIFAKKDGATEYDVLVYNYNNNSLNYIYNEEVNVSITSELPVGTTLYYRSISYDKTNNKLQNFLEENSGQAYVMSGFDDKGDPERILTEAGLAAYEAYENPNPHQYSNWESIVTTVRDDGESGSVISVQTEVPSFAFEKFEFRTEEYFTTPITPATVVWTTSEDFAPWTAVSAGMNVNTDNDLLTLNYSSGFAFPMAAITGLNINSDLYDTLQLVVKNSTEDTFLQMAANIPGTEFASGRKKITIPNDNEWHTIDVDLTDWSHWEGIINEFKVYESVNTGSIVFDRIEFIPIADNEIFDVTINKLGNGILNYESGTSFGGQQFDLNAIADQGWVFQGWSGDIVSTENPLTITVNSDLNITATFTQDGLSVDENNLDNAFTVFPNPSSNGVFTLKSNTTELWEVYSLTGVKVLSGKGKTIDISKFSNGIYIIKINKAYKKLLFN
ncbi:T9SS type A sorting domain-containing protein [Winogradskyella litoriviva]|uniref:T9SS type A sorting domain-containing protein n=1 Tax=Winogradskyella litoriviva TaxID=1220182 RepID=A0ABX2E430_9FLAO|nr:T9SS type A sorting domain-containing protein [Winogradskyella litoriviva]NRD23034.1 T9SS type A sorting domain-containing protein [Winogradskyella litoriviva]